MALIFLFFTLTMTIGSFIKSISEKTGLPQSEVRIVYDGIFDIIYEKLHSEGECKIPLLGKMKKTTANKECINPITKASLGKRDVTRYSFKPSVYLKK